MRQCRQGTTLCSRRPAPDDAAAARKIIADYKPQYPSIKAYLDAINELFLDKDAVQYDEHGNATVDFQN